ncbi:hypothetical protein KGQ24_03550 [Patescibacteria group bacterium]|nr:hypothetical protein [Patescibacteria group bacterium]
MKISKYFSGKNAKVMAFSAIMLGLSPLASVFAHDVGSQTALTAQSSMSMHGHYDDQQESNNDNDDNGVSEHAFMRAVTGNVTALGSDSSSFTLTTANKAVYTIQTDSNTKIQDQLGNALTFSDISVSDKVIVKGALQMPIAPMMNNTNIQTNNVITASVITKIPQNTHPAHAAGTVTAVNGNNINLQMTPGGIVANVPVVTSANTAVVNKDGSTATLSDIQANSRIRVQGLWDEVLNVLDAIKIRIIG